LSGFRGFIYPNRFNPPYPFTLFSLSSSEELLWGQLKTPWWWCLGSFVESWCSWVESTSQESVSPIPPPVFLFPRYFSPPRRSLCPMDRFEIPLVHCLHSCPRTILCNISKFHWLNQSDSWPRFTLKNWRFLFCNLDVPFLTV
jgi:hypothetical protein